MSYTLRGVGFELDWNEDYHGVFPATQQEDTASMSRTTTLRGNPLPLEGPELKVGDKAPDATLSKDLVNEVNLSEFAGKTRILSVVPSLDTPVCAAQTKRFNEEAANLPDAAFVTISCDLPTAQTRFCGAEGIDQEKLTVLSDHRHTAFGKAYGTLVGPLRVLSRAVFVVGPDDTIKYAEYVPEIAEHPDYDAALAAAKSA
jgi:thiol peroxidase